LEKSCRKHWKLCEEECCFGNDDFVGESEGSIFCRGREASMSWTTSDLTIKLEGGTINYLLLKRGAYNIQIGLTKCSGIVIIRFLT